MLSFLKKRWVRYTVEAILVVAAIAVIVVPALQKQGKYRLDEKVTLSIRLPDPPPLPDVVPPSLESMFGELKVAHVDIVLENEAESHIKTVRAESVSNQRGVN